MTEARATRPIALVSGASRGLGATLARFLAADGWDLIVTARGARELRESADALLPFGARVHAIPGDVADAGHRRALRQVAEEAGRLDLLVNNASELGPSPLPSLVRYPLDEIERVFRTNVVAPLGMVQELLPVLERSQALVVNISSDAALGGYPGWGGYGASKAALDLVSRTLAEELRERSVFVVAVDPGDLRTAMHQAAYPGQDISDRPLPEVTLPFWAWLLHQPRASISGHRFRAQAERWEVPA
jgi:NAD(P)-dependent dehydrogenase (short-subunit alcohol dehydrogenase family)